MMLANQALDLSADQFRRYAPLSVKRMADLPSKQV